MLPGAGRAAPVEEPPLAALEVPFLPQTERLCGGATAAMLFRYWGERHADVQQFAPLVDRRAGGISTDRLTAAIAERGWSVERVGGSLDTIRAHLTQRQPLILLLEVRPRRYHFVVVVAANAAQVVVHDPAVGPSRRYPVPAFLRAWSPTGHWALRVLPGDKRPPVKSEPLLRPPARGPSPPGQQQPECVRDLAEAVEEVRQRGLASADGLLGEVRTRCPRMSAVVSELAGVRFAQRRFVEAAALSAEATRLDPSDAYGWDLLGSSRFVLRDLGGALEAWNTIERPRLDSLQIDGLSWTHYARVAEILGLDAGTTLTRNALARADRRLRDLPTRATTRVDVVPHEDGWGTVRAVIVERPRRPRGWFEWAAVAAEGLVQREVAATVPGWTGQGEVWSAGWRWWTHRPRLALAYAVPRTGPVPGVFKVELLQASQTYAASALGATVSQDHLRGSVSVGQWLTGSARYEATAGIDRWDGTRLAASAGLALDRRFQGDRLSVGVSGKYFWPLRESQGFGSGAVRARWRSTTAAEGLAMMFVAGYAATSSESPLTEWLGAGDQSAASPLLRAHPLTDAGIIDGAGFGRRLVSATAEGRRWLKKPSILRVGVAAFVDGARAQDGFGPDSAERLKVDAGLGVRVRIPGRDGVIRVDYGQGLRDGARALTIGWTE